MNRHATRYYHVHKMLEGRWCITQSKWKHSIFKKPIPGDKSCLFTCIFSQLYLVVTSNQVNCRQETCLRQLVQQVIYTWQWINTLLSLSIQCSVTKCHTQFLCLLLNEDDGGPIRQARWTNPPLLKVFAKLPSHLC